MEASGKHIVMEYKYARTHTPDAKMLASEGGRFHNVEIEHTLVTNHLSVEDGYSPCCSGWMDELLGMVIGALTPAWYTERFS